MASFTEYREVKKIFLEAVDLETEARGAWITARCGDDRVAAQVRALLVSAEAPTGSLRASLAPEADDRASVTPESRSEDGKSRHRLLERFAAWDRFTGLEPIGRGGMGWVFKAHDPRLERAVALKFLTRTSATAAAQFRSEARLQARVDHENVIDVYETGEAMGQPYIVMKYVDGPTLRQAGERLAWNDKLELLCQVAEGIHAAHRVGLIHRDIKPANVLVGRDARRLKSYVIDFGIAAALDSPGRSRETAGFGSPRYMAPEQLDGPAAQLDPRTDVYGLGATCYELFSGRPPFAGGSIFGLLMRIRTECPRPLREVAPAIPPALSKIVMRCLEKDPEGRYPSAGVLAAELRRFRRVGSARSHPGRL